MRLRDVRLTLEQEIPRLTPDFRGHPGIGGPVEFINRALLHRALERVGRIPSFERTAKKLLEHSTFAEGSVMVDAKGQEELKRLTENLIQRATTVLMFVKEVLPEEPDGYVTVRLPSDDSDLSKVEDRFQSLVLAFERPVQVVYGTTLKVTLVEPGSTLVELGVVGALVATQVLTFIGKLLELGIGKAKVAQEKAKAEQEVHRVKQESAKADQEVERVKQERAKTQQEELKAGVMKVEALNRELRAAENRLRQVELQVEAIQLDIERHASESTIALDEPHEAFALVTKAINEVALLHESNVTFELQSNADFEVLSSYPLEALSGSSNGSRMLAPGVKGLLGNGS